MKVYISSDIEGVTGVTHWDETSKSKGDYHPFAKQMTREVNAACEAASRAGAEEIWVNDAHGSGRNLDIQELPKNVRIIRGWSEHPLLMVQELDESFDAVMFIGYHSHSGSKDNPLSHTMSSSKLNYIKINGEFANEFIIHSYAASMFGVPSVFVSGDKGLCDYVEKTNSNIKTVSVKEGVGNSTISIHPDLAVEKIKSGVEEILVSNIDLCNVSLPELFEVEISYTNHTSAYKASFYPGVEQISSTNVKLQTSDYFDVLRMIMFLI